MENIELTYEQIETVVGILGEWIDESDVYDESVEEVYTKLVAILNKEN